ncbi:uncharacterized protein LOC134833027 [Culicoides brevitarsis]|uniref:uncharacterized protein LOC134833027 n=1 Tax=Culicoides brevitarsis TaxID=469753 RepID=UPI00307BC4AB
MMKHTVANTVIFFLCVVVTLANNSHLDWDTKCGQCKCVWADGKKFADCRGIQLKTVPHEMSSMLQVLDLSNNDIAELRREEFANAELNNLHKLFIRNSAIAEVHRDALKGLYILIELDLSSNSITQLKPGTFSGLIKLRTVILNNNKLDRLEDRLFENLEHLHKIEFKHNLIHRVGLNVFVSLPQLQSIYLDYNRLSHLRKETFQKLDKLSGLSLTENPWNCTCDLKPFRDFAIDRNLYTQPTNCHGPKDLVGKMWNEVKSERFACKPRIIQPRPATYVTAAKDNVTLTCKVRGSVMEITWLFNKRSINLNDKRIKIKSYAEQRQGGRESNEVFTSDLTITNLRGSDKGNYVCKASNPGGVDEADITFDISSEVFERGVIANTSSNVLIIIALVAIGLLIFLIIVLISLCCYCRRVKNYSKSNNVTENGLINTKLEKQQQQDSIIEGGSVIMEMQKSLLTEVNPVEKPPRRADIESSEHGDAEDNGDVKRTLLDETILASHDDETQSLALSDTRPRSRQTFVDDGYGTSLPPDLLKFGNPRFPQSPSMQSSLSNLHDGQFYGKSPLASPVYQHAPLGYTTTMTPAGFRTLQHPKIGRTIAVANRSNSPFTPAPLIFPQPIMKQGYVTIPRKPRGSWAPSANSTVIDFPPTSPTSMTSSEVVADPIYDNLGMRTTASGYSTLELHKKGNPKYTMKDRPLPATPVPNGGGLTISSNNKNGHQDASDTEPLYPKSTSGMPQITQTAKIPPRPPPKPKKKVSVTSSQHGQTSNQIFEDECEDGTEV